MVGWGGAGPSLKHPGPRRQLREPQQLGERRPWERQRRELQGVAAGRTGPSARRTTRGRQYLASRGRERGAENAVPTPRTSCMRAKGAGGSKSTALGAGAALEVDEELSLPKEDEESFRGFALALDLSFFPTGKGARAPSWAPGTLIWPSKEESGAFRFSGVAVLRARSMK